MTIKQFLSVIEIRTKIVSLSTFFIALLFALVQGYRPSALSLGLVLAAVLLVDMGTTAFNSFFDYLKGVDRKELNREKEKVIIHEAVAPGAVFLVAAGLFAAAMILGIILSIRHGWIIALLGALSLAAGFIYSGGPWPLSHSPLGEVFAGGFLGSMLFIILQLVFGNGFHEAGQAPVGRWFLMSLPSAICIAAILTVNNTCDLEADRQAGRRTLSILIGRKASLFLIAMLWIAAFLLPAILFLTGWHGLIPLGAISFIPGLFLSTLAYRDMLRGGLIQQRKGPSMGGISRIFMLFSASMLAALLIQLMRG